MFFFGDPASAAEMMIKDSANFDGPGWPTKPDYAWRKRDSQTCLIYASSTLRRAAMSEDDHDLLRAICDIYEKHLKDFCEQDDVIYRAMKINQHDFPWYNADVIFLQRAIVWEANRVYEARKRALSEE
jgi:hypothetical protein